MRGDIPPRRGGVAQVVRRTADSSARRRYRFKSDGRQSRRSRDETVEKAAEEGRQSAPPDTKSNSKFILTAGKDRHYAAQTGLTVFFPFGTVAGSTPARCTSGILPHSDQKKQKGGVTGKCVQKKPEGLSLTLPMWRR